MLVKKALGFCSEMNAAVLPCLMSQLMVLSCLIRTAPIVSVGSWPPPPRHSSVSRLSTTGEGPLLPPGCGGPGVPRPLCNEGRDGGMDLNTLRPNASGYYF